MENKTSMTANEFEEIIDELIKGMTTLHNRLLRIEKWMLIQEGERKTKILRPTEGKKPR